MWVFRRSGCIQGKINCMRVLILANYDAGLYKFRRELLETLVKRYEVFFCVPDGEYVERIKAIGCRYVPCDLLDRHGTNPLAELKLLMLYKTYIKDLAPDVVLTYTVKPNIYGGMACAAMGVPNIANVTGLGTAVENPGAIQKVVISLYRYGLRKARKVFFQNAENRDFMLKRHLVRGATSLLPGSGVNLTQFQLVEYPAEDNKIVFLTIGRIMRDKGTDELLAAASQIKEKYANVTFRLLGFYDGDYKEKVDAAVKEGIVEYLGQKDDVHDYIKNSHATIHPSYHEGMSNVLLESAATGRPVLASNIPGCREAFDEGVSGIGFEPKNVADLVRAIERFIKLPYEQKAAMGRAGRTKMEREFDRNIVVDAYMKEIRKIEELLYAAL